ncbi:MAG: c-type cytochrome domain-containing protein [Verrucomicrobiota bacterium]
MKNTTIFFIILAILASVANVGAVNYVDDIMPIFAEKCFRCHSVESGKSGGNLEFDHLEDMEEFYIGKYTTMRPYDSKESLLLTFVTDPNLDDTMPPPGKGERLTAKEIALVKQWLDEGAVMTKEDEETAAEKKKEMEIAALKELEWVNKAGKTIKAKCLAVDDTHITFLMADGRELKYPLAQLSDESVELAKKQREGAE